MKEREYLFWLNQIPGFGALTIQKLWNEFHSFSTIYNIEETQLKQLPYVNDRQRNSFYLWKEKFPECEVLYSSLEERGILFVTPLDKEYPSRLRHLHDYPMGLYVRGQLPEEEKPSVAVVGARGCSSYGRQMAEMFGKALASLGVQVISGLATGVDGAAHRGAIEGKGQTYGILGCGVNICYPSNHYKLYEAMLERGGVISEFPLGKRPIPGNFPMRNRIISGLADLILVVEAKERSGSLITAELGLEQGKEVFAIPGRITDPLSEGCNRLINQGAGIALCPEDIIETFGFGNKINLKITEKSGNGLAKNEKMVYSCLDLKPKHIDEIAADCNMEVWECMGILFELESTGYAIGTTNHYYEKNTKN